jgi:hypothetical protein
MFHLLPVKIKIILTIVYRDQILGFNFMKLFQSFGLLFSSQNTFQRMVQSTQVVECLPSKDEALSSNPSTTKKKKKKPSKIFNCSNWIYSSFS